MLGPSPVGFLKVFLVLAQINDARPGCQIQPLQSQRFLPRISSACPLSPRRFQSEMGPVQGLLDWCLGQLLSIDHNVIDPVPGNLDGRLGARQTYRCVKSSPGLSRRDGPYSEPSRLCFKLGITSPGALVLFTKVGLQES